MDRNREKAQSARPDLGLYGGWLRTREIDCADYGRSQRKHKRLREAVMDGTRYTYRSSAPGRLCGYVDWACRRCSGYPMHVASNGMQDYKLWRPVAHMSPMRSVAIRVSIRRAASICLVFEKSRYHRWSAASVT